MNAQPQPFDPNRHRRGGRPRLPDEERRTECVAFWASPSELARIESAAAASLSRRGDYLRAAALADEQRRPRAVSGSVQIVAQIARAGNNLNQLARAVNIGQLPHDVGASLDAIRADFRAALHRLADAADDPED